MIKLDPVHGPVPQSIDRVALMWRLAISDNQKASDSHEDRFTVAVSSVSGVLYHREGLCREHMDAKPENQIVPCVQLEQASGYMQTFTLSK